jgi:signal transduction histidine kinase
MLTPAEVLRSNQTPAGVDGPARVMRTLLLAGFGGLLAIMLLAGITALSTLGDLHTAEEAARRDYLQRNQALTTVNFSVHIYGDRVEQYVMRSGSAPADPAFADQVSRLLADARSALQQYPGSSDPVEQRLLLEMEDELRGQDQAVRAMLMWRSDDRRRRGAEVLNRDLIPGRLQLLETSQQVAVLNRERLSAANSQLFAQFGNLRQRLTLMIVVGLAAGLLLSVLCAFYILRLERQARQRYQEIARSQHDLEQLSARLVDAQEEERRSLSRELHDEVGQSLGALLVDVARIKSQVSQNDIGVQEQLAHMKGIGEKTLSTVRNMALLLRPSMLDDLGLVAAIEWQGREISRQGQMEVDVHPANIPNNLPDDDKICIYRVVQEALNNATRHSGAKRARVELDWDGSKITVSISDDGQGFDSGRVRGLGLLGMEERVRRLGGKVTIHSRPREGTNIRVELPVPTTTTAKQHAETSNTTR